jgi:adenylate cyclase
MSGELNRRLSAVFFADVVGYSRLMGIDEAGTLKRLNTLQAELIDPEIRGHRGRVVKLMGDGTLAEFASVVQAVECALAIQEQLARLNADLPIDRHIELRIGVHLGDVIVADDDIFGDGVNVAARLQALAEPGTTCISRQAHDQVENKLAARFTDLGDHKVKNIDRPIRVFRVETENRQATPMRAAAKTTAAAALPVVAVLPFTNMSRDPDQEYFSDGLTEDIITALSHWRSFPVIARNSSFTYKGNAVPARRVAQELGARYVVEGSVRKEGGRVRVTAQLIDGENGHHVWAEKFDRKLEDVFDIQDEITGRIASAIAPELEEFELRKSMARSTENLGAWDFYLRGMPHFYLETAQSNELAKEMFQHAIDRDAGYSDAWARLGWSRARDVSIGNTNDPKASLASGFEAARRGVELDMSSPIAHLALGTVFMWAGDVEMGLSEAERALELNPYNANAVMACGNRMDLVGRTQEGIALMVKAFDLNPRDPGRWHYYGYLSRAHLCLGEHEQALAWAKRAMQQRPDKAETHHRLALCLAHLDRADEARAALAECERLSPGFLTRRADWRPYPDMKRNQLVFAGLKRLGLS